MDLRAPAATPSGDTQRRHAAAARRGKESSTMIRSLVRDNRGQELVEYALTLPIFLLLVIGIMEFGVTVFVYNTMANAAREGAR
ncbi:MAG: TadE family protein, partial [Chloroflexota bacterium]